MSGRGGNGLDPGSKWNKELVRVPAGPSVGDLAKWSYAEVALIDTVGSVETTAG